MLTDSMNSVRNNKNAGGADWLRNSRLTFLDTRFVGEWNDPLNLSG